MKVQSVSKAKFGRLVNGRKLTQELNVPSYFRVRAMDTKPVVGMAFNGRRVFALGDRYLIVDHDYIDHPMVRTMSFVETPWNAWCNSHCYDAMLFELTLREQLGLEIPNTWRELYGYNLMVNNTNTGVDAAPFWDLIITNNADVDFANYSEECNELFHSFIETMNY